MPPLLSDALLTDETLRNAVEACCVDPEHSGLYLVSEDDEACRVAAAWPRVIRWWVTPEPIMPLISSQMIVPWVWSGIRFPIQSLAKSAMITDGRIQMIWDVVRESGVVWPDGRLSPGGMAIFEAHFKVSEPGGGEDFGGDHMEGEGWKDG